MYRKLELLGNQIISPGTKEVCGCLLITPEEKILLLQSNDKKTLPFYWGTPAGKRNLGESPIECVKREIKEETGLSIEYPKKVGSFLIKLKGIEMVFHSFYYLIEEQTITLSSEHKSFQWVHWSELRKFMLLPNIKEIVEYFYSSRDGNRWDEPEKFV